jgi:glycoside/pentoside/hexuronide:cation symporter, GPH family
MPAVRSGRSLMPDENTRVGGEPESTPHSRSARELPLRARVLYAASSLGGEALGQSRGLWLLYFYAPPDDADIPELLPLWLAGTVLFAVRLIEAFDDLLVGWWSDRTRSRLGRRIPFVLAGAPFAAVFAVLIFAPPDGGTVGTAVWLFLTIELYFLFSTLAGGPYEALLPEIARTTPERLSVVGLRVYFGAAGAGLGLVGSGLLVDHAGFTTMAFVMAAAMLVTRLVGVAGVWRHASRTQPPAELSLREALRATLASSGFRAFLPSFVLFQVALQLVLGVLPFLVTAVLGVEDEGTWVAVLTATAIVVMLAAVPVYARVARRSSKRHAFSRSMLLAACVFPLVTLAGLAPGVPASAELIVLAAAAGIPFAGVYLFPAALTADICDDDALRTGMRREATYYGAQNVVEKTATSVTPLLLALLLLLGRSEENPLGIRLVGLGAGVVAVLAWLSFRRYELPDDRALAGSGSPTAARSASAT